MVGAADAVADEAADDREAGVLGHRSGRRPRCRRRSRRAARPRSRPRARPGRRRAGAAPRRSISPTRERRGGVGDHPVLRHADVERDDVALARRGSRPGCRGRSSRSARCTSRPGSPCSPSRSGRRPASGCTPRRSRSSSTIETPGSRRSSSERERAGDDLAGARHQLDLLRRLADDHARASSCSSASWISA